MEIQESLVAVDAKDIIFVDKVAAGKADLIMDCPEHGSHHYLTGSVTFTFNGETKTFVMEPSDWKAFQHLVMITNLD